MDCYKCVYRDKHTDICINCSGNEPTVNPKQELLPKVDIFRLASLLSEKKECERRSATPLLSDCPKCEKHSLFYNKYADRYECFACKREFTSERLESAWFTRSPEIKYEYQDPHFG